MSEELKKVFLHNFHKNNHAKFVPFAGFSMPINYQKGILNEHLQVRESAGLFDVSHMGQILISIDEKNTISLSKFIPLDFDKINFNRCYYSFLLNNDGGIIDDLIISKIKYQQKDFFYIVYNASRKKNDEEIFINHLNDYILLTNNSLLAIQGPNSEKIINFIDESKNLFFMQTNTSNFLNKEIIISRTGYTGEDGFEISVPNDVSNQFIEILLENSLIKLCGLGARDSLRIEAGLSLYGNELNEKITPIEANLTWSLHKSRLNDESLNGNKILFNQLNGEIKNLKVGLKSISRTMLRSNTKIYNIDKNQIGYISSGTFSPILGSSIGIGYINKSEINNKIYILIRNNWEELSIVSLPFIQNRYKRGG